MKKILVVDDSALMRRAFCDIINADGRFQVTDMAVNGMEALELLSSKQYDAVVLDVNMPVMTGIQLLRELQKRKIPAKVMMASTDTKEGARTTLEALELGAMDFIHKPDRAFALRDEEFKGRFLTTLDTVTQARIPAIYRMIPPRSAERVTPQFLDIVKRHSDSAAGNKVVAIASSTGGPRALQEVISRLPKTLNAPVVIVQHMPAGFTKSFAERLDSLSEISVKEADDGDVLQEGWVYVAMGGKHLNVKAVGGRHTIYYSDEPSREGVKPCANYMYESLAACKYSEVVCVVLTGMGADGTKGILNLHQSKKLHIIAQDENSCAVYGMPKSIVNTGLVNQVVDIGQVAQEIIMNTGVK